MTDYQRQANLFKLLMHPVRLAILDALSHDDEACVCHLEAVLHQRQAYISQQLMVLREAGLIDMRREGWNVYYRLVGCARFAGAGSGARSRGCGAGAPAGEGCQLLVPQMCRGRGRLSGPHNPPRRRPYVRSV